ncbi:hypothetical protein [Rosenbergiella epipactidis]|uniref:hypothetical protein n=1 Tax=Rosenbergiella epipactidis TaxID=1544694 RepID=UPI001F4FB545|nr:hypothetical protein [Rosenbergiella epipactidis]
MEREAILRLMTREAILFPEISDYLYETKAVRSRELLMDVVFGALLPHRRELEVKDRNKVTSQIKKRIEIILLGMGWL